MKCPECGSDLVWVGTVANGRMSCAKCPAPKQTSVGKTTGQLLRLISDMVKSTENGIYLVQETRHIKYVAQLIASLLQDLGIPYTIHQQNSRFTIGGGETKLRLYIQCINDHTPRGFSRTTKLGIDHAVPPSEHRNDWKRYFLSGQPVDEDD